MTEYPIAGQSDRPIRPDHDQDASSTVSITEVELVLRERRLLGPDQTLGDLVSKNLDLADLTGSQLIAQVIMALAERLAAARGKSAAPEATPAMPDVIPLPETTKSDINFLIRKIDRLIAKYGNAPIPSKDILLDKDATFIVSPEATTDFTNVMAAIYNSRKAEAAGVLQFNLADEDSSTLILSGVRLLNAQEDTGRVLVEEPELSAGEVEFHTHTENDPQYLDTVSFGDIQTALESEGFKDIATGTTDPNLRVFAVASAHEKKSPFGSSKPAYLSVQLYRLNITDMTILAKYSLIKNGFGLTAIGEPIIVSIR